MGIPQESRYLSSREEVAQVFELFRDQLSEIKLRFADEPDTYTARVLDLVEGEILLQNIVPRDGATHLRDGHEFSISGRADGLFVYITGNKLAAPQKSHEKGFFRVAMPTSVLYQQRRRSERVRVPVQSNAHRSHIKIGEINPIYARILDLSANGARIAIDPARPGTLRAQQRIQNCKIHVPNQLSVDVDLMVSNAAYNTNNQTMICGLELLNAKPTALTELRDFVAKITSNPF